MNDNLITVPAQRDEVAVTTAIVNDVLKKHEEAKTASVVNKYMAKPPLRRMGLYMWNEKE